MFERFLGKDKALEEGFATGFGWGADMAYSTIRMVLSETQKPFDEGGHSYTCECKPCGLIRDVLSARSA